MTATAVPTRPAALAPSWDDEPTGGPTTRAREWCSDVAVLTWRNLIHVRREPAQLSDATVQPILFTVLFVYIFGSAMVLPGGGTYKAFAIGGLVTMNLTTASMGTAVGLSSDLSTGVINRFRTLPMSRSAILAGRTISDLLAATLCASIVLLTGLVIGWRPDHGITGVVGGVAVAVLFAYALSWFTACIGLLVSDPESAQAVGLVILFPLAFLSSCFVPTQGLPSVLRTIADWNPISAVAGSCREIFGNPNPAGAVDIWPAQHPMAMALLSSLAILAVCVPVASHLLQKRTTD
ncbi:ABC transporter permease [Aquihabitans sp. G128]|uniref:ABC transporter permease n=1 Tax=Aquihabitans sp. G128 TaxID=2849779 RepID=UPI001C249801|nr:ABC transporter permease [Aquihabitans sp. G128]QXC63364.1 ABC transporter permease [Aquihabitans sp. G128]